MAGFVPRGARGPIALPRRSDASAVASRSVPGSRKSSDTPVNTHDVAASARTRVIEEIVRRGGRAREVREGQRYELRVDTPAGPVAVRVLSRRSGDWQTSTSVLDGPARLVSAARFWVFVDLADTGGYFVAPESWVVEDIRVEHERYLARNGGRRALTDDSTHHRVQTTRVALWRGRWDLLGLPTSG